MVCSSKKVFTVICVILTLLLALCVSSCESTDTEPPHTHTPSNAVKDNVIKSTCEKEGSYDDVVYCAECNEELSRLKKTSEALGHLYDGPKCKRCKDERVSEGLNFKSNFNGTCSVSGIGTCQDVEIFIPQLSPSGESVEGILASAFYHCTEITSVYIPDTVTVIGNDAFGNCTKLQSVTVSDNLTTLGSNVFSGCTSLQYNTANGVCYLESNANPYFLLITVEDKTKASYEIHGSTTMIYDKAFASCEKLTEIDIPHTVISIGVGVFENCTELVSATLSNSLTKITSGLFFNCQKLEAVTIPAEIIAIEDSAFASCASLKALQLPNELKSIGNNAFAASGITSIKIPNSVTTIGDGVFQECKSLTSITLPDNLKQIPKYMFKNCSNLESLTIPNGVTVIGEEAFYYCTAFKSINVPASVRTIEKDAFRNFSQCRGTIKLEILSGWRSYENGNLAEPWPFSTTEEASLWLTVRFCEYTWKR